MGAASSGLSTSTSTSRSQFQQDEITVVSERRRVDGEDPILERIRSLKIVTPLLKSPSPSESSFSEIIFNKASSSSSFENQRCTDIRNIFISIIGTLDPRFLSELFSIYRDWMEEKAKRISQKQEELENKLEIADALSVKLLQRYNHSVSAMRTTDYNLSQVRPLQIEVGELKGRLTEVISNCDALCKRIAIEPQTFNSAMEPFSHNN